MSLAKLHNKERYIMDSIRIIQLPTKSAAGTDDYIAVDSTANGTKKIQFPNLLDDGLTIQNKAADAKATGDAISEVNGAIGNEASTRQSVDANLQTQIDQLIAPSGQAPSAAEVENARIGAPPESTVYPTLGDAIRGQVSDLKSELNQTDEQLGFVPSVTASTASTSWTKVYPITGLNLKANHTYLITFEPSPVITVSSYGHLYDSNNTQLKYIQLQNKSTAYIEYKPTNNVSGAKIAIEAADAVQHPITISIEDVYNDKSIVQMQNAFALLTDEVEAIKAISNGFPSIEYVRGNIDSSTGVIDTTKVFRIFSKNIEVASSDITITAKTGYRFFAVYYSSGVFSSSSSFVTSLTIPKGTEYRLVIGKTAEDNTSVADIYTFASNVLSTYDTMNQIDEVVKNKPNSIIDSNIQLSLSSGFLSSSNGSAAYEAQSHVTDFIKVEAGETIKILFAIDSQNETASWARRVCFYDSSKSFVSCPTLDWGVRVWGAMYYEEQTLTVPSGCAYVRASLSDNYKPFALLVSTQMNPFNAFGFTDIAKKGVKDKSFFNGCVPILHAGADSGIYPNNTINNLMYNILNHPDDHRPKIGEVDVKCCSDNVWVVSHEQSFEYNGVTYQFSTTPSATAIAAGIPIAEDFVRCAHQYNFELMWDIGGSGYTSDKLKSLVDLTKKYHMIPFTFFATGEAEDLKKMAIICPQANLAYIQFYKPNATNTVTILALNKMITGCMMLYLERGNAITLTETAYIDDFRSKDIAVGVHGFNNADESVLSDWAKICDFICVPQANAYDYILHYDYE